MPFAGSGVAGFFMGMFLIRILNYRLIAWDCVRSYSIDLLQARQYIQGQVDWNRLRFQGSSASTGMPDMH